MIIINIPIYYSLTLIPTEVAHLRHVYMFEAIFFYLRYLWSRNFEALLFSIYCWHRMSWNMWNLYTHVLNGKYSIYHMNKYRTSARALLWAVKWKLLYAKRIILFYFLKKGTGFQVWLFCRKIYYLKRK